MKLLEGVSISQTWLTAKPLQTLFDLLSSKGEAVFVVGGAVRNALSERAVRDVDVATVLEPELVVLRLEEAGHKAVPTGIDHGTVTAVVDGNAFEVTTLREDIETDGRHAVVRFGTDWGKDAERRDFTMNALYCDKVGRVFDPLDGYEDLQNGLVRFIGNPEDRIREDALRILRFFRFFAWYGTGRPDAAGLKACTTLKEAMNALSAERVWSELKRLLDAPDPGRALLWMRTTGVLGGLLHETAKWGIDAVPGLIRMEVEQGWQADPLWRLMAMVRPDRETVESLAERLSLSNMERDRLVQWSEVSVPDPALSTGELEKHLYRGNAQAHVDAMRLEAVHLIGRDEEDRAEKMLALAEHALGWKKPAFPLAGKDLKERGIEAGPGMGAILKRLEDAWIESGFSLSRSDLLAQI